MNFNNILDWMDNIDLHYAEIPMLVVCFDEIKHNAKSEQILA